MGTGGVEKCRSLRVATEMRCAAAQRFCPSGEDSPRSRDRHGKEEVGRFESGRGLNGFAGIFAPRASSAQVIEEHQRNTAALDRVRGSPVTRPRVVRGGCRLRSASRSSSRRKQQHEDAAAVRPPKCRVAWIRAVSESLLPFHGCRSGTGYDGAPADARTSSVARASEQLLRTPASDREREG